MHSRLYALPLAFVIPLLSQSGHQSPPFRAEVNLVGVSAVVRSADGHLLPMLQKQDFELAEDGVPQTIQFFAHETDLPLNLGLIVDVSGSQEKFLRQHSQDIQMFLRTVLRPTDRSFAVCFGNHLRLVSDATPDSFAVLEGLTRFQKGARDFPEIGPKEGRDLGTALYDAIYFAVTEKMSVPGERRRALVVFSDGEENSSEHDLLDVLEAAQNANTLVYCIRYTEMHHGKMTARNRYGTRALKHIASLSGAADFNALSEDLGDVFRRIGEELRSIYQISYVSSNGERQNGVFRKVKVTCKQPSAIVRAKSGYYSR